VLNPAGCASPSAKSFVTSSQWLTAPEFLWQVEDQWPAIPCQLPHLPDEFAVLSKQTYSVNLRRCARRRLDVRPSVMFFPLFANLTLFCLKAF